MPDLSKRLREPLVFALLVAAVAGWLVVIALWINNATQTNQQQQDIVELTTERDRMAGELEARAAAEGALAETETQLAAVQEQLAAATASHDNISAELANRREDLAVANADLESRRGDAEMADERLAEASAQVEDLVAQLQELNAEVETANQQLNDVGARLEQARNQEAQTTERLAQHTEEAAAAAASVAESQSQLQSAREQLAATQSQLTQSTTQLQSAGSDLQVLQQQIVDLSTRREELAGEVDGYLVQRDQLQPQVENLSANVAARGEELSAIEARISEITAAADTEVSTGRFVVNEGDTAPGLTLILGKDDRFTLSRAGGPAVEGSYTRTENELALSNATGPVGDARFPMTCPIAKTASGFTVGDAEGCLLAGLEFHRVQ